MSEVRSETVRWLLDDLYNEHYLKTEAAHDELWRYTFKALWCSNSLRNALTMRITITHTNGEYLHDENDDSREFTGHHA